MRNILKNASCFFFCFLLIQITNYSEPGNSLQFRNIKQQQFAMEYIKNHEPESGFKTAEEVLIFMQALSDAWSDHAGGQSDAFKRLNTYVPMWAVYSLFDTELPEGSKCLVWSQIALPSFLKDVEYLENELQRKQSNLAESAYLIFIPNLAWAATQSLTYRCSLTKDQWKLFKESVFKYPDIIQQYLDAKALPDSKSDDYRQSYERVKRLAIAIRPFIELQDKMYENQFNDVFASLASQIPNERNYLYIYVEIGKCLFQKLLDLGKTDLALATLDLLAKNTSEKSLTRKELQELYQKADPERGPARFKAVNTVQSGSLIKTDKQHILKGSLFDLTSGNTVEMDSYKTQFVVLDFWSVNCGPCIKEIPRLNALAEKYQGKLTLLSINSDLRHAVEKEYLQKFVARHKIKYPVLLDTDESKLMEKFNVNGWPTRYLLSIEGYFYVEPVEKRRQLSLDEIQNFLEKL